MICLAVFLTDCFTPLGVNIAFFYLLALWLLYSEGKTQHIWLPVSGCSLLTIIGIFPSLRMGGDLSIGLGNRAITIGAIWVAAALASRTAAEQRRRLTAEAALLLGRNDLQDRSRAMLSVLEDLRIEREKLAHRERELHVIVESAPVAMVVTDRSGRILLFNAEAERVFGYHRQEVLAKSVESLMPERYRSAHGRQRESYHQTPEARAMGLGRHLFAQRKDGSEFPVEIGLTPLETEPERRVLSIIVDITERKRAEEAQRLLSENLAREVEERTRDLRQARDAAWEASQAKSAFLANMSHEIRTPMNGIIGMTELLLKTPLSAEQRHYQAIVKESADSLLLLLNDILDLSKIEAGKLELLSVDFDPRDCVGSALQGLGYAAAKKGVELACHIQPDVPHRLAGDANRLHQVLVNLAGNAVKFTDQGEIVVQVCVESRTGDYAELHFQVRDTGCGIPSEKLETIFESFTQVDATARRRYGGTGLGLAISRQLVELMQGRIWVESSVNQGSTFHFTARFGIGSPASAGPEPAPVALAGRRILVVDDNATNRTILVELLREWKALPLVASSGPDALHLLERLHRTQPAEFPEVVLLDMMMPGMDGSEVARKIRESFADDELKIVILSSLSEPISLREMAQLGVDSLLSKPVRASQLLKILSLSLGVDAGSGDLSESLLPEGPLPAEACRLRILLAEDNRVNRMVAGKLLEERGHTVVPVENGALAVAALEREDFDAVLMDVQMPVMDGLTATSAIRLREQATGRHVPIIALTANAMGGDRERCIEAGMDAYVAKPVRSAELFTALEQVAGKPLSHWAGDGDLPPRALPAVFDAASFQASIGDTVLMREMVKVFEEDSQTLLQEARQALERADGAALHRAAHTLKGMVGNFSAEMAFQCTRQLSERTRNGQIHEGLDPLLTRLETEITRLRDALRKFDATL